MCGSDEGRKGCEVVMVGDALLLRYGDVTTEGERDSKVCSLLRGFCVAFFND